MPDDRLFFPATTENCRAIWAVLEEILPEGATVLEVASGSGEHAVFFASLRPALQWIPSDPKVEHRRSIAAWTEWARRGNVLPPLDLDASSSDWPLQVKLEAVVAINLVHIAPWDACLGLLQGASRCLKEDGFLYLYGAYRQSNIATAPSNVAFDRSLRAQNPEWGVRNLEDVSAVAVRLGFGPPTIVAMPANNLSVIFRKVPSEGD